MLQPHSRLLPQLERSVWLRSELECLKELHPLLCFLYLQTRYTVTAVLVLSTSAQPTGLTFLQSLSAGLWRMRMTTLCAAPRLRRHCRMSRESR